MKLFAYKLAKHSSIYETIKETLPADYIVEFIDISDLPNFNDNQYEILGEELFIPLLNNNQQKLENFNKLKADIEESKVNAFIAELEKNKSTVKQELNDFKAFTTWKEEKEFEEKEAYRKLIAEKYKKQQGIE